MAASSKPPEASQNITRAFAKGARDRRASDIFRVKAGHMLAFDDITQKQEIAEHKIMRKVIKKNIKRNQGCMTLPLTIAYFAIFAFAARLKEDITNVFLLESASRHAIIEMFEEMDETIPGVWDTIETRLVPFLFSRQDDYGVDLPVEEWNRVLSYSQIQGLVAIEQTRTVPEIFGKPYVPCDPANMDCSPSLGTWGGTGNITGQLLDSNEGFEPVGEDIRSGLGPIVRRLRMSSPSMDTVLPKAATNSEDLFSMSIFPREELSDILTRLNYFRDREWLDKDTQYMSIVFYVLNAELGRPRVLQTTINFYFSPGGSIFFDVEMITMFLEMWASGVSGLYSMGADGLWVVILSVTTYFRSKGAWAAFLKNQFMDHILNLFNLWEWCIIMVGWYWVYGILQTRNLQTMISDAIEDVVVAQTEFPNDASLLSMRSKELHETAAAVGYQLGIIQMNTNWYLIVLMFRFFVSFSSQPRLAIVVNTLKSCLTDLLHFLVVFAPTFFAYVISGNILFGRRLEDFCTIPASLASCARIVFENEYDWDNLSREHYVTTAIWIWSMLLLVVLLMLNMVLAIILDMYNDVRQHSSKSEAFWETLYNFGLRLMHSKHWVRYTELDHRFQSDLKNDMISREDLLQEYPNMPEQELELLFSQCTIDMEKVVSDTLNKQNCLGVSGSIQVTVDRILDNVKVMNSEDADDPMKCWAVPGAGKRPPLNDFGPESSFITANQHVNGPKCPRVKVPGEMALDTDYTGDTRPEWLVDVAKLLQAHRKWMTHIQWQMQHMHWQMQVAQGSKAPASRNVL